MCPFLFFYSKVFILMRAMLIFGGILIIIPIVFLILLANGWIVF